MAKDDDLLTRLGRIARERDSEAEAELAKPSVQLRDPNILRDAIVRQALAQRPVVRAAPRARIWWAAGMAAAAAALLLVWVGTPSAQPLPRYALLHQGGLEAERGAAQPERLQLQPSSRFQLELKPQEDVSGPVELQVFAQRGDKLSRLTPDSRERSESGAFRVSFVASRHFGRDTGEVMLIALVCRPDTCEQAQAALRDPSAASSATWQVLRIAAVYAQ